jgi:hypothetical protein
MWGTKNIYNKKMYGQKVEIHIKIGTKNIFNIFFIIKDIANVLMNKIRVKYIFSLYFYVSFDF